MSNIIYHAITRKKVGTVKCISCDERVIAPPGSRAYCKSHRNNASPLYGWLYVSQQQRDILKMLDDTGSTQILFNRLNLQKAKEAADKDIIHESVAALDLSDSDPLTPTSDSSSFAYDETEI